MGKQGKYIYGIIPHDPDSKQVSSDDAKSFGPCGITACEEVYALPYKNIWAVVSDSEIVDYTHMRKDALAMFLVRHQRVIEKIMGSEYTIIPVKLGTFAQDEDELIHILLCSYSIIKDITSKVSNKIEIDLAATWSDFTLTLKEIGEEKEIKQLKERLLANPKVVTMDDQMKVGFMVKKALDEKRGILAQEIQSVLKDITQGIRVHELMDDKMVINCAFLIDKRDRAPFYKKVEELNDKFAEKLNFRCVGPLPPYSFYTLEVKKMQSEDVDWAKKKLDLNDIASKDEVKKAYRRSAFFSHPDKNPGDIAGAEKEFDEVSKAYKILIDYCEACEQIGKKRSNNCFKSEELRKPAILVKVRE